MDAPAPPPTADIPLPTDVAALQAVVRERLARVHTLEAENADLKARLDAALKHRFGRRSERRTPPPTPAPKPPPRRDPHGRSPRPDHLERRDVAHDLTAAEKVCPCCGRERACIGDQTAEQLDLDPARFFVRRTIKKTYACRHCDPTTVPAEQRMRRPGRPRSGRSPRACAGRACWPTPSRPSSPTTPPSTDWPDNWPGRV